VLQDAKTPAAVAGHFGEWLQGRLGPDGPVALITLACPALRAAPGPDAPPLPAAVIARFFAALGAAPPQSGLALDMPPGGGAGASTAALLALARLAGVTAPPEALAAACITAEGASDPLMLPHPDRVLWASRAGRVLRPVPPPPRATIVGAFFGPPQRTRAQDVGFADITDLVEAWCAGPNLGRNLGPDLGPDLATCAALASESARRCTALRGGADPMPDLARELGALGHCRAHTGSAPGMIFAPGSAPHFAADALREPGGAAALPFQPAA